MADEKEATATPAVQPLTEAPSKKTVVATAWPTGKFTVGNIEVTQGGVELSAEDAKKVLQAAKANGVKLVEKKKEV